MKKLLLAATMVAGLFTSALAQTRSTSSGAKLSVGLEFGVPVGNFGNAYTIGFGGSGKAEIPVAPAFNFTVTAGYTTYYYEKPYKNVAKAFGLDTYQGYVPLKVGGKYFFSPNVYGEAEIGAAIGTNNSAGTAFAYAPGLGISYPVSNKHDIDFGVRYEGWSQDGGNVGQVAFRLAYKFGL